MNDTDYISEITKLEEYIKDSTGKEKKHWVSVKKQALKDFKEECPNEYM